MLLLVLLLMVVYKLQTPDRTIRLTQPIPWPYAFISMGYIVFWAALRSGFADTRAYIYMFDSSSTGWDAAIDALKGDGKSPGFNFIQIIFKSYISTDFHWWFATIAILSGIPIMLTFRKYSVDYLYSMFLFVASTMFIWMFNGIRQFLIAAIVFAFCNLIENKKLIRFSILILLCSIIHSSVWIMFPMYFFVTGKPFGKKMLLFVLGILACVMSISSLMSSMEIVLQDTNYAANLEQFAEDDGVHPLRVLMNSIPLILAFIRRKQIAQKNNQFINMCINMSAVSAGLFFVGIFTSGVMIGRLPVYFTLFDYILIPYLINHIYADLRKILYIGFSITYIIFYYLFVSSYYYISDVFGLFIV